MKKILLIFLLISTFSFSAEIKDIKFPKSVIVNNQKLFLNGVGIRNKFFIDAYIGGLYLTNPTHDPKKILASNEIISLRIIINLSIPSKRLMKLMLMHELKISLTKAELKKVENEIDIFLSTFNQKILAGDTFVFNIIPNGGIKAYKNNQLVKVINNDSFNKIILKPWIGDRPVEKKLKSNLLGVNPK